jgi:DNA replication protein DnaC
MTTQRVSNPTDGSTNITNIAMLLRDLRLPSMARTVDEFAQQASAQGWSHNYFLHQLLELETDERRGRRIERHIKESGLPAEKTLAMLKSQHLPAKVYLQLTALCDGSFLSRGENILAFGLPGRGKTHVVCAIGHELVRRGYRILFAPTYAMVQRLLVAKRDLRLEREMEILERFDAIILDDIGYVQQNREEMEVLFTLLAARYERKSVMITSNLVFSEWDRIFKDPMTTAAAVDRLVHHSIILELTGASFRNPEGGKKEFI